MKRLMRDMSNEDMCDKIEYESAEYFFLEYVSLDSIQDEDLRNSVQRLRLAWEEIMEVVEELADELDIEA